MKHTDHSKTSLLSKDCFNASPTKTQFTQIPNELLRIPELSFKAKGLLLFILSHPKVFQDLKADKEEYILANSKEGTEAIRSGIKELQKTGILTKQIQRNQDGESRHIIGSTWEVHNKEIK